MQRRAAVISAVIFLVVGAAAYSLIATANEPEITLENPDYELSENETFEAEGVEYEVTNVEASMQGGGDHGGEQHLERSAELIWVNESARFSETWENNTSVEFQSEDNQSYRVLIEAEDEEDPDSFVLEEELNRTQILSEDPDADNETVEHEGEEWVVIRDDDDNPTLVPADEYFSEPERSEFSEGESFDFDGNETTVENVTAEQVEVVWTAEEENTVSVSDESNVTLGENEEKGQQYLAYFPDNETLYLTQDHEAYEAEKDRIERFDDQKQGLWGVVVLTGATVVLLLGMAFLPSRY